MFHEFSGFQLQTFIIENLGGTSKCQEIAGPPKKGPKKRDKKVIHKFHNPLIRPIFLHRFSAHGESKQEVHNLLINLIRPTVFLQRFSTQIA